MKSVRGCAAAGRTIARTERRAVCAHAGLAMARTEPGGRIGCALLWRRSACGRIGGGRAAAALDQSALQRLHGGSADRGLGEPRRRLRVSPRAGWISRASRPICRWRWSPPRIRNFPSTGASTSRPSRRPTQLNQHSHRVRGASTISQQVAKNLFLWSGRSYFRKGLEAYFTVLIEALLAEAAHPGDLPQHRRIRLRHLRRRSGRRSASSTSPRRDLTRGDAAVLAAVLPNPERYSAAAPSRYVQRAARLDPGSDAGAGRPGNAGRNRRLSEPPPLKPPPRKPPPQDKMTRNEQ